MTPGSMMDLPIRGVRVLVVEDAPAVRELLNTRLSLAGYRTQQVSTGWAALQVMQDFRPDAVILDINMPGLDGFGVLETKRGRGAIRDIPVMVLSARHAADDIRRALALGAKDYLSKPFEDQQMLMRVRRLIRMKRHTPPPDDRALYM